MTENSLAVRGVAHDLNNQLMILLNSLDRIMILDPDLPDARHAMKAAEHCAELAARLLPNARPRHANALVSVRETVSEAAMLIRVSLPPANKLEVECPADCLIHADPFQIQQALVNLCLNAVEAMDGPGIIRLSALQEGGMIAIAVSDTGPGVPANLQELIFDPLFTTNSAHGGCGLGLPLVRQTVERFGGTITYRDVYPRGACFRILLPIA
jgi:signal transduction histidine kinase